MPRRDDDEPEDDDRPRRKRPRDEDDADADDRPARSRRPRDEDEPAEDRPRKRRPRDEEDEDFPPPRKKKKSSLGLVLGIVGGILLLCCGGGGFGFWYAINKVGGAAERLTTTNDLKQTGLACMNYQSATGTFPTNSYSPDGRPLLSWRVHILPYVEQDALYRQFKLDEPWDSPANKRLLDQMPVVYATPAERTGKTPKGNKTYIRGFSSPGALFEKRPGGPRVQGMPDLAPPPPAFGPLVKGVRTVDVKDGMSNTILALEAGDPVEWTKPDDLDASPGRPFPSLGGVRPKDDVVLVLFADGSVRAVKRSTPEAVWRAGVTYAGNDQATFE